MEYATLGHICAPEQGCSEDRPYLARIGDIADEAYIIGNYIQDFIDRCRGGGQASEKIGGPVPSGHLGNLDRLQENIGRVDRLARELQTIG
jgi:hypothetical protein